MKEKELRENSVCSICGKKIGASGLPFFWTVELKRYGLNMGACQRQQGLGLMLGGPLAQIMGPDEDLAEKIDEKKIVVCETCASDKRFSVYEIGFTE